MDTWHKLYESISFVTTQRKSVKNTNARGFISDTNNTNHVQADAKAQFSKQSGTNTGHSGLVGGG